MYFTTQKGLSMSQTILLDSIRMFAGCFLCIPIERLFKKITPIKSSMIGNLFYILFLIICIYGKNFFSFAVAQIFLAIGYVICAIKNNLILSQTLESVHRDKDFNKISGKGLSLHYIIDSIGAIIATYVFTYNPDLCLWLSVFVISFSEMVGLLLKEPSKFQNKNIELNEKMQSDSSQLTFQDTKKNKADSYVKILMSSFLVFMLVYMFFFRGANAVISSGFKMYLQQAIDFGRLPIWMFGYIYALFRIVSAFSSKYQFKFDLKFGVRSLLIFNTILILGFVVSGTIYLFTPFSVVGFIGIIISNYLLATLRSPNEIFINNYMQVCIAPKNIEKAYSIRTMVEYLGYACWNSIYSLLVEMFSDNYGWTSITFVSLISLPIIISLILFVRALVKKHAQKYTIIKDEYVND